MLLSGEVGIQKNLHKYIILGLCSILRLSLLLFSFQTNPFSSTKQRLFTFHFFCWDYNRDCFHSCFVFCSLTELIFIFSFIFHSWSLPNKRRLFAFAFRFTVFRLLFNLTWDSFRSSFFHDTDWMRSINILFRDYLRFTFAFRTIGLFQVMHITLCGVHIKQRLFSFEFGFAAHSLFVSHLLSPTIMWA